MKLVLYVILGGLLVLQVLAIRGIASKIEKLEQQKTAIQVEISTIKRDLRVGCDILVSKGGPKCIFK